ncbi:hypothetical protein HOLleu_07925 [Holothuria leucospilota]|uniref:Uncharacterized protein n=1 Tax=Holothuria leucospilota TaxID=206669 RepID=A0A9Q1CI33_HOLLE|nr:hypothetical protein HOLleu_07925 [Holothuria leucospilota]
MNKLILCIFVALAALVINVRWSTGSLDTFFDDFVSYPSLKAKRDLEFEEFVKDGDMKAAKKRAMHRQKRMNEENMSDDLKRIRRNLREAEEEEEDHDVESRCSADEYNGIERGTCQLCQPFDEKIKYYVRRGDLTACSDQTIVRFEDMMKTFTQTSDCVFEESEVMDEATAHVTIACDPNAGNVAPMGKNPNFKVVNVQQVNAGKAGYKIISHELGHLCCLPHIQKLKGSSQVETAHMECVESGMEDQFTENECVAACSRFLSYPPLLTNVASVMQYKQNDFGTHCSPLSPKYAAFGRFNARNSLWIAEIFLIREAYCKYCPSDDTLEYDEVFGQNCTVLQFVPAVAAHETELSSSPLCIDPGLVKVECGSAVKFVCPDGLNNMALSKLEWQGIPEHSICKSGVMRVLARDGGNIGELAIMCGDGVDTKIDYVLDCKSDYLLIDGKGCTTGEVSARLTAC